MVFNSLYCRHYIRLDICNQNNQRIDKKIQINKVDTGKLFSLNNPTLAILTREFRYSDLLHFDIFQDSQ